MILLTINLSPVTVVTTHKNAGIPRGVNNGSHHRSSAHRTRERVEQLVLPRQTANVDAVPLKRYGLFIAHAIRRILGTAPGIQLREPGRQNYDNTRRRHPLSC